MKKIIILILTASMLLLTFYSGNNPAKASNSQVNYNKTTVLCKHIPIAARMDKYDGLPITGIPILTTPDDFVNSITVHNKTTFTIFKADRTLVASIIQTSRGPAATVRNGTSTTAETVLTNGLHDNTAILEHNGDPSLMDYLVYPDSDDLT